MARCDARAVTQLSILTPHALPRGSRERGGAQQPRSVRTDVNEMTVGIPDDELRRPGVVTGGASETLEPAVTRRSKKTRGAAAPASRPTSRDDERERWRSGAPPSGSGGQPGALTARDKRRVARGVSMAARARYMIEYHTTVLRHAGGTDRDLLEILGVVDHYTTLNTLSEAMQIESDIRPPA